MKKNPIYESLIDKSIGSMLSAIEIYNKPDFKYREETFAILAINSWELLLKARLLKLNNYRINSIYCYKPYFKYPFTYKEVIEKAKNRYSDFKCGTKFNTIMKSVKQNVKLYYERKLDSKNPKSQKQGFYSPNIWQVLDNHYTRDRI